MMYDYLDLLKDVLDYATPQTHQPLRARDKATALKGEEEQRMRGHKDQGQLGRDGWHDE